VNCSSSEALFERFLDGDVVPRERAALLAHVDGCTPCRELLEELRVVDALLLTPRSVSLAPNFTFATMAEVRTLHQPRNRTAPLLAYLASYTVASWLIVAAAFILSPRAMRGLSATFIGIAGSVTGAFGGLGHVFTRLAGHDGPVVGTVIGGVLVLDLVLAVMLGIGIAYVRPRLVERLRS
jgi:anti-sigma factor RsiW